jgi:hypothetical protein
MGAAPAPGGGTGAEAGSTMLELGAVGAGIEEASESELAGRLGASFSLL